MDSSGETTFASNGVTTIKTTTDASKINGAVKTTTNMENGRDSTTINETGTNGTTTNGGVTNDPTANGVSNGSSTAAKGQSNSPGCPFKFTPVGSFRINKPEEVMNYYDNWADTYDEWTKYCGYRGPEFITELVKKYCQTSDLFLIVGVGTGLEAQLLYENGYHQLHGLDGSIEMLNRAKTKGHLLELFHEYLQPNVRSSIESHRYDTMLCVGCFVPGALDERHVDDLMRTVKPGGLAIIGTRENFINNPGDNFNYPFSLETKLKQLEQAGAITLLERVRKENYGDNSVGIFFIHRVNR